MTLSTTKSFFGSIVKGWLNFWNGSISAEADIRYLLGSRNGASGRLTLMTCASPMDSFIAWQRDATPMAGVASKYHSTSLVAALGLRPRLAGSRPECQRMLH
jgi:hypothetical protein